ELDERFVHDAASAHGGRDRVGVIRVEVLRESDPGRGLGDEHFPARRRRWVVSLLACGEQKSRHPEQCCHRSPVHISITSVVHCTAQCAVDGDTAAGYRDARRQLNLPHLFFCVSVSSSAAGTPFSLACRPAGSTCSQHAATWPAPTVTIGGAVRFQTSIAYGQRGRNRQPLGGASRLGGAPCPASTGCCPRSGSGAAESNSCV